MPIFRMPFWGVEKLCRSNRGCVFQCVASAAHFFILGWIVGLPISRTDTVTRPYTGAFVYSDVRSANFVPFPLHFRDRCDTILLRHKFIISIAASVHFCFGKNAGFVFVRLQRGNEFVSQQ